MRELCHEIIIVIKRALQTWHCQRENSNVNPNWIPVKCPNLTNQSRNVLSKKVMVKREESMDNITLFSIITVMSFLFVSPCDMEGVKFTPAYIQSTGVNMKQMYIRSLIAALCFHAYQQVSYMILQRVSPITHSVGNCVKRVVVIVSSVLFFQTSVVNLHMCSKF